MIKLMIMVLLTSVACNSSKNTTDSKNKMLIETNNEKETRAIIIKKKFEKTDEQLRFKIKKIVQKEDALVVDVTFGGGCVDNHVFELYSTGTPDDNGIIDLFLLHKTEDNCKMLLMQQRVFDISKLNKRKSFTSFRLNNSDVLQVKKAK